MRTEPLPKERGGLYGHGEILLGGKRLPRLKPRPFPMTEVQQKAMNKFFDASLTKRAYEVNDGLVKVEWASYGKKKLVLSKPHDHAGMIEDPAVVDELARAVQ